VRLRERVKSDVDSRAGISEEGIRREVSRRFQEAAAGQLVQQVRAYLSGSPSLMVGDGKEMGLVVSGGVASNLYIRERCVYLRPHSIIGADSCSLQAMADDRPGGTSLRLYYPPLALCTGQLRAPFPSKAQLIM
jgi:tRNA A37 threonylcarbamoyltransferase TsaD